MNNDIKKLLCLASSMPTNENVVKTELSSLNAELKTAVENVRQDVFGGNFQMFQNLDFELPPKSAGFMQALMGTKSCWYDPGTENWDNFAKTVLNIPVQTANQEMQVWLDAYRQVLSEDKVLNTRPYHFMATTEQTSSCLVDTHKPENGAVFCVPLEYTHVMFSKTDPVIQQIFDYMDITLNELKQAWIYLHVGHECCNLKRFLQGHEQCTKEEEFIADRTGLDLAVKNGIHPYAVVMACDYFAESTENDYHPSNEERQAKLMEHIKKTQNKMPKNVQNRLNAMKRILPPMPYNGR